MKFYTIVTLWLIGLLSLQAQTGGIKGKIIDAKTKEAIAYANISVFSAKDSLVTGGISNEKGKFIIPNIPSGKYRLLISFMGYENIEYQNFIITQGIRDMGTIEMQVSENQLKEVIVESGKPPVTYKVDRKIIHASAFPEASVAIDLLNNIPSLKIDVSGKITYRNDAVFQVFINGKPVIDGVERLRQIPRERIDRIEIITNPSAKYAAEGTAGIINVILKKNRLKGYRINSSVSYQTTGQYRFLFSIGRNSKRSEWYMDAGLAMYKFNFDFDQYLEWSNANGKRKLQENGFFDNSIGRNYINFGYNYDITSKDEIDISFGINPFSETEFHDETAVYHEQIYDATPSLIDDQTYRYSGSDHMTYQYIGPSVTYTRKFDKSGDKKLEFATEYYTFLRSFDEEMINQKQFENHSEKTGSIYRERNEKDWDLSLDFTYDFSEAFNLETGGSMSLHHIPQTTVRNGIYSENGELIPYTADYYSQEVAFKRDIYAGYISMTYALKKWKFKSGLRYEWVDREADYSYKFSSNPAGEQSQTYHHQYGDWFPSAYVQYSWDKTRQVSFSYSRRINRSNYFWLIPVKQYNSPFSYSLGNEKIQPSFVNSWEINYQKSWDKDYFSIQAFAYQKDNLTTFYKRVDEQGLQYSEYINAGNSFSSGIEIGGNYHIFSWWNVNLSLSAYQYYLHLQVKDEIDTKTGKLEGNVQLNQDFDLPRKFKLQLKTRYDTPWIYMQTQGEAVWTMQVSLQKRLNKHWKFTLFTNNLWGDIVHHNVTRGTGIYIRSHKRNLQYLGFKLAYGFNNRK